MTKELQPFPEPSWEREWIEYEVIHMKRKPLPKEKVVFSAKDKRKMDNGNKLTGRSHGTFKKNGQPRGK